jgi:hypothetical protein
MKIFGYEIWASRTRYITPLSLRFWCYRNWMGGMVFGVRLFGYKWECGYYGRNLTRVAADIGKATAYKPDPIEVYYPDTEQTKECDWCHQMNNESNSFCWHCEGEI